MRQSKCLKHYVEQQLVLFSQYFVWPIEGNKKAQHLKKLLCDSV